MRTRIAVSLRDGVLIKDGFVAGERGIGIFESAKLMADKFRFGIADLRISG
jgi:hypothetical protein